MLPLIFHPNVGDTVLSKPPLSLKITFPFSLVLFPLFMNRADVIVNVVEDRAVVIPFPPDIVTVLSLAFAVYDPLSPAKLCNTFWTTLGDEFVIVRLSPATSVDIPVPPTKLSVVVALLAVLLLYLFR